MSKVRRVEENVPSFEKVFKDTAGLREYRKMSKEDKKVIHEMSECQKRGGPIGSAVVEDNKDK